MAKNVTLTLTEEEARFLHGALDRVELRGIAAARTMSAIAEKLAVASRFAAEWMEPSRVPLEQALLARIAPLERASAKANGLAKEETK